MRACLLEGPAGDALHGTEDAHGAHTVTNSVFSLHVWDTGAAVYAVLGQSIVSIVSRKVHRGAYSPCDVICSDHAAPEHKQGEEQVADTSCLSCVGHAASAVSALQVHNADMVPSPLHDASRMVWL